MRMPKFTKLLNILKILEQENFDVKNIKVTKPKEGGKYYYIVLREIEQEDLDIQDVIAKYNLDGNYPYGRRKAEFDGACHGINNYTVTEKAKEEGKRFVGETSIERLLRVLETLKSEGVNINKIKLNKMQDGKQVSTTISDISQNGVDIDEIIRKHNLDPEYKIGIEITRLRQAYNEKKPWRYLTNENRQKAKELGIVYDEKERTLSAALNILDILQSEGVDINRIKSRKGNGYVLLKDISQEGIDIEDIIKRNGLDENYQVGKYIRSLKIACKGKGTYARADEDIEKALELLDTKTTKGVERLFEILELLKAEKVDISKIIKSKKLPGQKHAGTTLMDIKQDGIDMKDIIRRHNLDGDYKIGSQIASTQAMYNGKGKRRMTIAERKRAEKLGIFSKKAPMEELLDILEVLSKEGVDVSRIHQTKRLSEQGKETTTVLSDIKQSGINIDEIITANNLDGNYKIGAKITKFRQGYKGKNGYTITEDDKRRAEKLGIVSVSELETEQRKLQEKLNRAKQLEQEAEGYSEERM